MAYTTPEDVAALFRPLSETESKKVDALIPAVEDILRQEAKNRGMDLDDMLDDGAILPTVFISVVVDVVGRTLMTSTEAEPVSQFSQSALGYSVSGTYLNPGGGIFVKKSELKRLGIGRQRIGGLEFYD